METIVAVADEPTKESIGGSGGIYDYPGRYYLSIALGTRHTPLALRDDPFDKLFTVARDARPPPRTVGKVIIWTDGPRDASEPAAAALGPGWTRTATHEYAVRDFWNWRRLYRCTRSVYVRIAPAGDGAGTKQQPPARCRPDKNAGADIRHGARPLAMRAQTLGNGALGVISDGLVLMRRSLTLMSEGLMLVRGGLLLMRRSRGLMRRGLRLMRRSLRLVSG